MRELTDLLTAFFAAGAFDTFRAAVFVATARVAFGLSPFAFAGRFFSPPPASGRRPAERAGDLRKPLLKLLLMLEKRHFLSMLQETLKAGGRVPYVGF
ncbi:MAG TPA: hypothetical protein VI750_00855 [Pyrinomonadaceae bacterium]|nr:hypothetical protein [Pyrinomonadaceae bacterium]